MPDLFLPPLPHSPLCFVFVIALRCLAIVRKVALAPYKALAQPNRCSTAGLATPGLTAHSSTYAALMQQYPEAGR
eukprot:10056706-Alexandrium_andersonii.AAC.1